MKERLKKLNGKDLKLTEILMDKKETLGNPAQVSQTLAGKFLAAPNSIICPRIVSI